MKKEMLARATLVNFENIMLSQAQKATYDTNRSIPNDCNRQLHRGSNQINDCHSLEAGGEWEWLLMGACFPLETDENVLKLYSDDGWTTS